MAAEKYSASMDDVLLADVRDGLAAVAEWEAEHGRLTEAELAAARQRVASQVGVITSDEADLEPIAEALRPRVPIRRV
jgi:hypothetical protein